MDDDAKTGVSRRGLVSGGALTAAAMAVPDLAAA